MWLVGIFLDAPVNDLYVFGLKIGNVMSRCITFACFAFAVAMMSSWYVFERRIRWFLPLSFFLPSVSLFVHGCVGYSLSLLLFLLVIHRTFACNHDEDCRYGLFSAFVIFSILLGLLTPYWFLFGIDFIFPNVVKQAEFFVAPVMYMMSAAPSVASLAHVVLLGVGLLVLVPFVVMFSGSASPGKPLLRKRLVFFAMMNVYLMALSLLYSDDFLLYYIWSLPSLSVMLTFVFSLKITAFSRYYFIIINLIWLAMLPFSLWLIH